MQISDTKTWFLSIVYGYIFAIFVYENIMMVYKKMSLLTYVQLWATKRNSRRAQDKSYTPFQKHFKACFLWIAWRRPACDIGFDGNLKKDR